MLTTHAMLPLQILPSLHFKIFYSAVQYLIIIGLGLIFRETNHVLIRAAIGSQLTSFIIFYIVYVLYGVYKGFYIAEEKAHADDDAEAQSETGATAILGWIVIVSLGTLLVLADATYMCAEPGSQALCGSLLGGIETLYASSLMLAMEFQICVSSLVSYVRYSNLALNTNNLAQQIVTFSLFIQSFIFSNLGSHYPSNACKTGASYRFGFIVALCVLCVCISFSNSLHPSPKVTISRHLVLMWFAIIGGSQLFRFCDAGVSTFNLIFSSIIGALVSFSKTPEKKYSKEE